jgi:hypothetical protein
VPAFSLPVPITFFCRGKGAFYFRGLSAGWRESAQKSYEKGNEVDMRLYFTSFFRWRILFFVMSNSAVFRQRSE